MKKTLLTIALLLASVAQVAAETDIYLNVSRKGVEKIKIAIPDFLPYESTEIVDTDTINKSASVMRADLYITEYFSILWNNEFVNKAFAQSLQTKKIDYEEWKLFGVDYVVTATYRKTPDDSLIFSFALHNLKAGSIILEKKYQGDEDSLRQLIHRFSDDVLLQLTGEKGIATTKLLFESVNKGNKTIYMSDYDGADVIQISDGRTLSLSPAWSEDNTRVYYTSFQNDNPGILMYDLKTGSKSWFSNKKGLNNSITISSNGMLAAYCYAKNGNPDIIVQNLMTKKELQLTRTPSIETSPTFSPDGRKIAFVSDMHGSPQIFMVDVEGGTPERLTFEGNYNSDPSWSPDGDKIAFTSINGSTRLAIVNIADKKIHYVGDTGGYRVVTPSWSPNGKYLVYSSNATGQYQLYRLNVATGTSSRVTFVPGGAHNPAWSFFRQ